MNYPKATMALIAAASCLLVACNQSKSADQVARDTAAAERTAENDAAKAQQRADARIASAQSDVRDEQRDLAHVRAVEGEKVAEAAAAGDYNVARARCESLSGATQKACRDQAEAGYDLAKARARQDKAGTDPRP